MIFFLLLYGLLKIINRDSIFVSEMDPEKAPDGAFSLWLSGLRLVTHPQLQADPSAAFRSRKALLWALGAAARCFGQLSRTCSRASDNPHPTVSFQPHGGSQDLAVWRGLNTGET